jgi:hypothetical protein
MTAIANGYEEVDELYRRTLAVLDRTTAYGRPRVPVEPAF